MRMSVVTLSRLLPGFPLPPQRLSAVYPFMKVLLSMIKCFLTLTLTPDTTGHAHAGHAHSGSDFRLDSKLKEHVTWTTLIFRYKLHKGSPSSRSSRLLFVIDMVNKVSHSEVLMEPGMELATLRSPVNPLSVLSRPR